MAFVGDALRYFTSAVDARVVTPVAARLANSVANPYVLSYFVWDRLKKLTPQRARDLTRLVSTAVTNAVGVMGAEEAKQLAASTRRLQDEVIAATVTPQGKDVILNSIATASKVAQALNTPETKVATQQIFETFQSLVDYFASAEGRKIIQTAGECVTNVCEVIASPESAVLLAEIATNICHTLEVEAMRRDTVAASKQEQEDDDDEEEEIECEGYEDKQEIRSPLSSAEDTAFETESYLSEFSLTPPPAVAAVQGARDPLALAGQPKAIKERSPLRSVRIEKDVLLKMGVNPSMLEDVQRILDRLREEQQREEAASRASMIIEEDEKEDKEEEEDEEVIMMETDQDDHGISSAFGIRSSSLPMEPEPSVMEESKTDTEDNDDADGVVLPEWHPQSVRSALRRRHVAAGESQSQRHALDDQSQAMTQLLAKRRISHGDLQPEDVLACRVISQILIIAMALFVLLLFVYVARMLL